MGTASAPKDAPAEPTSVPDDIVDRAVAFVRGTTRDGSK